jgi:secretion/DNA translocation related TadE-like protein
VTLAGEPMAAAPAGRKWARPGCPRAECSERAGRPGQLGGASLVALALTTFLLLAGLLAVDVGALAAARAGAQTAADMAALAALTPGGDPGAANAAAIAAANGAELVRCDCSTVEAVVTVRRRVALAPIGLSVWVTARARAVLSVRPEPRRATSARGVRGARSGSAGAARVA